MALLDTFLLSKVLKNQQDQANKDTPKQPDFDPKRLGPKEVYLTWEAISRPHKKMGSEKMTRSFMVIGVIVALFFVMLQEYFLILVVASLIFITQVLSKTPPEKLTYEVSSYGLRVDETDYYWHEMSRFFFYEEEGISGLAIDMVNAVPSRLFLTIYPTDKEKLLKVLGEKLQYLDAPPETFLDRAYKSVTSKFQS